MTREMDFQNLFSMVENMIAGVGVFEYEKSTQKFTPLYLNEGCFRMLGYSRVDGMRYANNLLRVMLVEDRETFWQGINDVLKDDGPVEIEFRTITSQGSLRWFQVRGNLYSRQDDSYIIVGIILDSTERKNVEEELRAQAERLDLISQSGGELIFDYNAKTDVMTIKANQKKGFHQDIILERYINASRYQENIAPEDHQNYIDILESALRSPRKDSFDVRAEYMSDQGYIWYRIDLTSVAGMEGYVTRVIGRMTDIHDKKLKEMDLEIKAEKDSLTGLYNKGATEQLIRQVLNDNKTEKKMHALLMIDLDNFKQVNDLLGHAKGDEVLQNAAAQIANTFKGRDIVGRIGGDEFLVLMNDIQMIANADLLATRLCRLLKQDFPYEGGDPIKVTGSIGIAIAPYHGDDYETLFKKADNALYSVKAAGKGTYRIYDVAATIAYHNTRREGVYREDNAEAYDRSMTDIVFQLLFEDKDKSSALRSALELIGIHYGMQNGYLESDVLEERIQDIHNIKFVTPEFPNAKDDDKLKIKRRLALEKCFEKKGAFCVVHNYDDFSDEVCDYMQQRGIRTMIVQSISEENKYIGSIVLESQKEAREGAWSTEQMEDLQSVLRILNMYMLEEQSIQYYISRIAMLNDFDSYVYVIDKDTYRIQFLNNKVAKLSPEVKIGDLCYQALQGRDTPCENCILNKINKEKTHDRVTEECFNYSLRIWTRAMVSWLECRKEHPMGLINCVDISEYFIG